MTTGRIVFALIGVAMLIALFVGFYFGQQTFEKKDRKKHKKSKLTSLTRNQCDIDDSNKNST